MERAVSDQARAQTAYPIELVAGITESIIAIRAPGDAARHPPLRSNLVRDNSVLQSLSLEARDALGVT